MKIKRYLRALFIALATYLIACGVDKLSDMETSLGLDTLFKLRGSRAPPAEVVVVAMDETSETNLGVWQDLTRWRGFHAKLIRELKRQGVELVVFDLALVAPHPEHDPDFAEAIKEAGNVLLIDCVQKQQGDEGFDGRDECSERNKEPFVQMDGRQKDQSLREKIVAMRKIPPTPVLAESALLHAPFYLPKVPVIREGWDFVEELGDTPTLPVLAWFHYLQRSNALQTSVKPAHSVSAWLNEWRKQCLLNKIITMKNHDDRVICPEDSSSRYLDFYGPPETLRMESYSDVYEGKATGLMGKVVFVGKAGRLYSPGKTDVFETPFTDLSRGKMAGVEIMATQFANLLEGRFIASPLPPGLFLLAFSMVVGFVLVQFAGITGIAASLLLSGAYAGLALWYFSRNGWWLPMAVPLLIQLPVAWLMSLLWSRRDLLKERKRILQFVRRVFPQWMPMPSSPGEWFPEISGNIQPRSERDVFGLCLATDIEGYTTVAAQHTAHEMWELLNAYYQVLGHPVSSNNGIIADVTGDAMMAVWIDLPVAKRRLAACLAALEMEQAVELFNETSSTGRLPTRIGLHEGDMTLGRLDAGQGSHYRAIGDTVSTASRIQGVNKYLGTRILASAAIVASLNSVVYRPVGSFRLVGKDEPIALVEIVGMQEDTVVAGSKALHEQFALGLQAFQLGKWKDAAINFQLLLKEYGHDAPGQFYLNLAQRYLANPPSDWDGVVTLSGK
jgi:adenylate cyclase